MNAHASPLSMMKAALPARSLDIRAQPPAFSVAHADSAIALSHCMTGWNHAYEQVGRGRFSGRVRELWLWPLQLIHESLDQPCVYRGAAWQGSLVFALPLHSEGRMVCAGRLLAADSITAYRSAEPRRCFVNGPIDNLIVCVDGEALARCADGMGLSAQRDLIPGGRLLCTPDATGAFQSLVSGILAELEADPALLDDSAYRERLIDRILGALVGMLDVQATSFREASRPTTRAYVVEKADQYMRARIADAIHVSDISTAIRVSARTLRYSFEDVVGVSPAQYLQGMRLNRVRDELLNAHGRVEIRSIAERHGFRHMGRFARYYQSAFGERPRDTCR